MRIACHTAAIGEVKQIAVLTGVLHLRSAARYGAIQPLFQVAYVELNSIHYAVCVTLGPSRQWWIERCQGAEIPGKSFTRIVEFNGVPRILRIRAYCCTRGIVRSAHCPIVVSVGLLLKNQNGFGVQGIAAGRWIRRTRYKVPARKTESHPFIGD